MTRSAGSSRCRPASGCCRSATGWPRSIPSRPRSTMPSPLSDLRREHAADLGADPAAIALGGDSAGAIWQRRPRVGRPRRRRRSPSSCCCSTRRRRRAPQPSRGLFASGFLLTDEDIVWFCDHYMPPPSTGRPRASILLADDLTGMPPTYLVTAGSTRSATRGRCTRSGSPRRESRSCCAAQPDLVHGFVNMIGLTARCREAVAEAAGALRAGLGLVTVRAAPTPVMVVPPWTPAR